jgi:uncharacterized protein YcgI (DUF1989 family)
MARLEAELERVMAATANTVPRMSGAWRDLSTLHPRYAVDREFYEDVRARRATFKRRYSHVVEPFTGHGVRVEAGETLRVIQHEGPQIGDLTFWNAHGPTERMSSLRTWALEGWFIGPFSRVWSDVPWLRPMATCIGETFDVHRAPSDPHHHVVACQCSSEQREMRMGEGGLDSCRLNFLQGIEPLGLSESDIRENLDVFQGFRFEASTGWFRGARTEAKAEDHIEFFAEMDLIAAVSVCPSGAGPTSWSTWNEANPVLPLRLEIYTTGIKPRGFPPEPR